MANTAKVEKKTTETQRQRRSPTAGLRDKLTIHDRDPNYVYRWVRNDEGRIERFKEIGYEVVTQAHEVGQKNCR